MRETAPKRTTTPEEEGIELYPDAMERTERAVKAVFRHGPIPRDTIKGARRTQAKKPRANRP